MSKVSAQISTNSNISMPDTDLAYTGFTIFHQHSTEPWGSALVLNKEGKITLGRGLPIDPRAQYRIRLAAFSEIPMNLRIQFIKRLAVLVGCTITADLIARRLHVSEMTDHVIVLSVLMFGAVIFANAGFWSSRVFWRAVTFSLLSYIILLCILLRLLSKASFAVSIVFLICLAWGWGFDRAVKKIVEADSAANPRKKAN